MYTSQSHICNLNSDHLTINFISLDTLLLSMAIWHILVFNIVNPHTKHISTFSANITIMRHKQEQQTTLSAFIVSYAVFFPTSSCLPAPVNSWMKCSLEATQWPPHLPLSLCMCSCACMCVQVCMQARGQHWVSSLLTLHLSFWGRIPHLPEAHWLD